MLQAEAKNWLGDAALSSDRAALSGAVQALSGEDIGCAGGSTNNDAKLKEFSTHLCHRFRNAGFCEKGSGWPVDRTQVVSNTGGGARLLAVMQLHPCASCHPAAKWVPARITGEELRPACR